MTPTDVAGWIEFAPRAAAAIVGLIGLAGLLENTERGRRITARLIDRITR